MAAKSLLTAEGVRWMSYMVKIFVEFVPLGTVLVALLGVGWRTRVCFRPRSARAGASLKNLVTVGSCSRAC